MADDKLVLNSGRFAQNQIAGQLFASASGTGALRTSWTEPPGLELSRSGARFAMGQSAALTGIAPVQAMPTTAAQWSFWNASSTKSLVFEMLGAYTTSGVAGVGSTVVCAHYASPSSATTKAGITIANLANSTNTSVARINSGVTITSPTAPGWFIVGRDDSANTVALNVLAFSDNLYGTIIVPPLRGLALCVIAPTGTTPLYAPMAQWTEVALDLE